MFKVNYFTYDAAPPLAPNQGPINEKGAAGNVAGLRDAARGDMIHIMKSRLSFSFFLFYFFVLFLMFVYY
jgi:hypothetical protein